MKRRQAMKAISVLLALSMLMVTGCGNEGSPGSGQQAEGSQGEAGNKDSGMQQAEGSQGDTGNEDGSMQQGGSEEEITLRVSWWGPEARHEATLEAMDYYMELHPNIKLVGEYGDWNGHYDKIVTQLASGTAPDIIQVNDRWYYDFTVGSNAVIDMNTLTDYVDLSAFDQSFLENYCSYDGKLLGLPLGVTGVCFLYNKDFFAEHNIPEDTVWTWDNLLEIGERVHQENPDHYLYVCETPEMWVLQKCYVKQRIGTQMISEDYTLNITPALFAEALAYGKEMVDRGVTEPFETASLYTDVSNENPKWINGEEGLQQKYITNFSRYQSLNLNYGVCTSPVFDGMLDTGVAVSTGNLFGINSKCQYVKEAAEFINWFVTAPEAVRILKECRSTQATEAGRKLLADEGLSDPLVTEAVNVALENASNVVDNGISQTAEFERLWQDYIEKVIYGKMTPEDAGQGLYDDMIMVLEELKALEE